MDANRGLICVHSHAGTEFLQCLLSNIYKLERQIMFKTLTNFTSRADPALASYSALIQRWRIGVAEGRGPAFIKLGSKVAYSRRRR